MGKRGSAGGAGGARKAPKTAGKKGDGEMASEALKAMGNLPAYAKEILLDFDTQMETFEGVDDYLTSLCGKKNTLLEWATKMDEHFPCIDGVGYSTDPAHSGPGPEPDEQSTSSSKDLVG